jgi:HSP20 family protein
MPTLIRRSETITLAGRRREIFHAVGWQVTQSIWSPPTDVYETDNEYIVRVEIAGMRESDFEIIFENGNLFVSGVRPDVAERRAYHQMEIRFGKFSTAIAVPGPVDLDRSEAQYKDGFMTIVLLKTKSKEIKIEE